MLQSQLFAKIKKEVSSEVQSISHKLLLRGDFIEQLASGIYSFLPLGWLVHEKIASIIRDELNKIGAQEVHLPVLQPKILWESTNRWDSFEPPLFKLKDQHGHLFALGPTHEEVITDLASRRISSYKDLPLALYQIQLKFRNETRATSGLLRTVEFYMKDLYSFHATEQDLSHYYEKVKNAYLKIFKRCNLNAKVVQAATGSIGGTMSHELMVLAQTGEDKIAFCLSCDFAANCEILDKTVKCPQCKKELQITSAIEQGHIFNLGQKYSNVFNLAFLNKQGKKESVYMGCYGIGIGRLMATVVEVNHDDKGIIWPIEISPFDVHLIVINQEHSDIFKKAQRIYKTLKEHSVNVLFDDRKDMSAGEKFVESDIIGIPLRIVVSKRTLKKDSVEIKKRFEKEGRLVKIDNLLLEIRNFITL